MSKEKSLFQERLVGLYLRLNGYFQTGYVPHSDKSGHVGTDVDRLAIRLPFHDQQERQVISCPALQIPNDSIDLVLAEVKTKETKFNEPIKSGGKQARENWSQILRWSGLFKQDELKLLIDRLIALVDKDGRSADGKFEMVPHENKFGQITIRPIIFSIESVHCEDEEKKFINGQQVIDFLWECFCPEDIRLECATRYPFTSWGFEYTDIVEHLKALQKTDKETPCIEELYAILIK